MQKQWLKKDSNRCTTFPNKSWKKETWIFKYRQFCGTGRQIYQLLSFHFSVVTCSLIIPEIGVTSMRQSEFPAVLNDSRDYSTANLALKKKAAGRFQSCNYFPVLWILLHAAPPLTSVIYKAKRKLQLSTHIMFWLSVFSSCAWLHGEWEGNTWKELGPASKQKKQFPPFLLCSWTLLLMWPEYAVIKMLIVWVLFWFLNCRQASGKNVGLNRRREARREFPVRNEMCPQAVM